MLVPKRSASRSVHRCLFACVCVCMCMLQYAHSDTLIRNTHRSGMMQIFEDANICQKKTNIVLILTAKQLSQVMLKPVETLQEDFSIRKPMPRKTFQVSWFLGFLFFLHACRHALYIPGDKLSIHTGTVSSTAKQFLP